MQITDDNPLAPLSHIVTLNGDIITTLTPVRRLNVKNSYTEFHENLTYGIVVDARPGTERWIRSAVSFSFLRKL